MAPPALPVPDWFRTPDRRFRPAAFWFWHHVPSEDEISARLGEIAGSGLGTILIQARLALPLPDYLSPAYLAACRFSTAEAKRLGIGTEIYDEYNWMSGHGGGRVVTGADHLRERHLFWASATLGPDGRAEMAIDDIRSPFLEFLGQDGLDWCYEGGAPVFDEWELVAAVAAAASGVATDLTAATRIADTGPTSCRIAVAADGHAGETVTVFIAARCRTSRLINYLRPEAAERFAEIVYAPLMEAADGEAKSMFFDHPYAGFYTWAGREGDLGNSLLWDASLAPDLPDAPLGLQLLALLRDVGPQTAMLRGGFFAAYASRMHEAFFGTLRRWCDAKGIAFSGHELLTHVGSWNLHDGLGGIDPRSMPGVDYFGVDAYRSATTVDAADYQPQLAAKFGDSVARAHGRGRCTVEQYSTGRETGMPGGAGQWGLTLARLRAQAIRHTLFGARRILLHALYLDDGFEPGTRPGPNPRFDFAPGFNVQPWWQDAPPVLDALARLSAFLEDGEPLRSVALLYPLETIRAEAMAPDCGRHFGWWAKALSEAGIGFDIVDEADVAAAASAEGLLRLPSGQYGTLILPAVTTFASLQTAEVLADFANSGGTVLFSGGLPGKSRAAGADAALAKMIGAAVPSTFAAPADEPRVCAVVKAMPNGPMRFADDGPSWTAASRVGDTLRMATFNDGDHWRTLEVALHGPARVVRWLPESGERLTLATAAGTLRLSLAPQALLCLEVIEGAGSAALDEVPPRDPPTSSQDPARAAAADPVPRAAVVLADGWTFSAGNETARSIATDRGWERQGYEGFAGTGHYHRTIDVSPAPPGLGWYLLLPGMRDTVTCRVSGALVGRSVAGEAAFALPEGRSEIELIIRNTAANRYYPGTIYVAAAGQPSGLVEPPQLVARPAGLGDLRILQV